MSSDQTFTWTRIARRCWRPRLLAVVLVPGLVTAGIFEWRLRQPFDATPYLNTAASPQLLDRNNQVLHALLNEDEHWLFPAALADISPRLIEATIATEDQRFWTHNGIDWRAVARAIRSNITGGDVRSGASTLTMQLVKLSQPRPANRWLAKASEAWMALRLERNASKEAILTAYLNKAPYGGNLLGVEAACQRYFGKSARELTLAEAALIAGLPKAPSALQPLAHPERALSRRNHVLTRMRNEGYIEPPARERASAQALAVRWHEFPTAAPHLARARARALRAEGRVQSTLDGKLQRRLEALLPRYLKRFDNEITNAAAIVIDPATSTVLARVGSAGFFSVPGGQMDLCATQRSPGSALKPFTYGLAMQRNLLYPSEKLLDDTLDLGSYNPGNFDGEYHGLVSAKQALGYSLNVPAVMALRRVGVGEMYQFLRSAGFDGLVQSSSHYGLGLTLGNCEVTLEQLAAAYTMLANEGWYQPLRLDAAAPLRAPVSLLERGAVLALFDMLEAPLPQEIEGAYIRPRGVHQRVAWKTGTSTGQHDAWSVVFNKHYVVAVWVGNADGRPSQRIVGAHAALPLAGRIFRELESSAATPDWPAPEGDLREVTICAVSGLPRSPWCKALRTERFPAAQYLNRQCAVHNLNEERWPGSPNGWDLARIGPPSRVKITQASLPAPEQRFTTLRILSPVENAEYLLTGEPQGDQIRLRASTETETPLHWYLNEQYLGTSSPGDSLQLDLTPGTHRLSCMTPTGEIATVSFSVRIPEGVVELKSDT